MNRKVVSIGILPQEQIRARVLAIAKGKYKPKPGEPKIWFTSMRSLAEVLSDENRSLLRVIRDSKPASLAELAELTGRKPSNPSRTLNLTASINGSSYIGSPAARAMRQAHSEGAGEGQA